MACLVSAWSLRPTSVRKEAVASQLALSPATAMRHSRCSLRWAISSALEQPHSSMANTGSEKVKSFFKEWLWEILSIVFSIVLITAFWMFWVYGLGEESPMAPSSMVFLFYALVKVAVFNALSWLFTFVATRDIDNNELKWKTWAVFMLSFSLSSLA